MKKQPEGLKSTNSSPLAATMQDEVADDKNSTNFKVKNFTSETNYNDNLTIREELKSVQKSIALFKQDIRKVLREELFKFLNEGQQQAIGSRYK